MLVAISCATARTASSSSGPVRAGSTAPTLAVAAFSVASIGAGGRSVDHALGLDVEVVDRGDHRRRVGLVGAVPSSWPRATDRRRRRENVVASTSSRLGRTPTRPSPAATPAPPPGGRRLVTACASWRRASSAMWVYAAVPRQGAASTASADREWAAGRDPCPRQHVKGSHALAGCRRLRAGQAAREACAAGPKIGDRPTASSTGQVDELRALRRADRTRRRRPPQAWFADWGTLPRRPARPHRQLAAPATTGPSPRARSTAARSATPHGLASATTDGMPSCVVARRLRLIVPPTVTSARRAALGARLHGTAASSRSPST